ncbi:angiopoietin-2-like [Saccostrea cucullata]|uniref:angiopoietin-2-like n=1 Tax=Saccostrea cuccullata TaxID=36930 RepID=UPI002ED0394D
MKFVIVTILFVTISNTTGVYDQNSTVKEIDVLRQIINQETLIRLALVKDVRSLVDEVSSMNRTMTSTETMTSTLQHTVETMKRQLNILTQENKKIARNYQKSILEFDQKLTSLSENVTSIHQYLKNMYWQDLRRDVDCEGLYNSGHRQSGVFRINPYGNESQINVYCDMKMNGGGWTAIQKRKRGAVEFNRTWSEYKEGFGDPQDSYWIGNDVIHHLTKGRNSTLYVSITLPNDTVLYEMYGQFSISDEEDKYRLFLGEWVDGTLGDGMLHTGKEYADLSGMYFSTRQIDNDNGNIDCAVKEQGAGGSITVTRPTLTDPGLRAGPILGFLQDFIIILMSKRL